MLRQRIAAASCVVMIERCQRWVIVTTLRGTHHDVITTEVRCFFCSISGHAKLNETMSGVTTAICRQALRLRALGYSALCKIFLDRWEIAAALSKSLILVVHFSGSIDDSPAVSVFMPLFSSPTPTRKDTQCLASIVPLAKP